MKNKIKRIWKRIVALFCLFSVLLSSCAMGVVRQESIQVKADSIALPSGTDISGLGGVITFMMVLAELAVGESVNDVMVDFDSLDMTPEEYYKSLFAKDGEFCKQMTESEYDTFIFQLVYYSDPFNLKDLKAVGGKVLVPGVSDDIWSAFEEYAGVESGYYVENAAQQGGIAIDYGTIVGELSEFVKYVLQNQDPDNTPNPSQSPVPSAEPSQLPSISEDPAVQNSLSAVQFSEAEFAKLIQTSFFLSLFRALMAKTAQDNQKKVFIPNGVSGTALDASYLFSVLRYCNLTKISRPVPLIKIVVNNETFLISFDPSNPDAGAHSSSDVVKYPDCQVGKYFYPIFYWDGNKLCFTIYTDENNCHFPNDDSKSLFTAEILDENGYRYFPFYKKSKKYLVFDSDGDFIKWFVKRFSMTFAFYVNNKFLEFRDREAYEEFITKVDAGTLTLNDLVKLLSHSWKYKTNTVYPELEVNSEALPTSMKKASENGELDKYKNADGKISISSITDGAGKKVSPKPTEVTLSELIGNPQPGTSTSELTEQIVSPIKNPQFQPDPNPGTGTEPNPNPGTEPNPNPNPGTETETKPDDIDPEEAKTPGLQLKFPFCIPWDVVKLVTVLSNTKKCPKFTIPFKLDNKLVNIDYAIKIDFSDYDKVIAVLRWFLLFSWIFFLVMITRKMLGQS